MKSVNILHEKYEIYLDKPILEFICQQVVDGVKY